MAGGVCVINVIYSYHGFETAISAGGLGVTNNLHMSFIITSVQQSRLERQKCQNTGVHKLTLNCIEHGTWEHCIITLQSVQIVLYSNKLVKQVKLWRYSTY